VKAALNPSSHHLELLRRMQVSGQPLVCRAPWDYWCVADSEADSKAPRDYLNHEKFVHEQTVFAMQRAKLLKKRGSVFVLTDHGHRTSITHAERQQSLDQRRKDRYKRAALMWMLRANGYTFRAIGELLGSVTGARVKQIVRWYEMVLRERAYSTHDPRKGFEARLRAAGAIPSLPPFPWDPHPMNIHFLDMDLPDDEIGG
jgi:hypothetical protein